jgi:hypothetical protein
MRQLETEVKIHYIKINNLHNQHLPEPFWLWHYKIRGIASWSTLAQQRHHQKDSTTASRNDKHRIIWKTDQWNLLQDLGVRSILHRASLYADDLILFLRWRAQRPPVFLLHIFTTFKGASGLGCNLNKCQQLAPIRCETEAIQVVTEFFPCPVTDFPGVPLSLSKKLPRASLQPLVDKVANYLPLWKGQGMNRSGRLALIKSTRSLCRVDLHFNQHGAACMGYLSDQEKHWQGIRKDLERLPMDWVGGSASGQMCSFHWLWAASASLILRKWVRRSGWDGSGFISRTHQDHGRRCHA